MSRRSNMLRKGLEDPQGPAQRRGREPVSRARTRWRLPLTDPTLYIGLAMTDEHNNGKQIRLTANRPPNDILESLKPQTRDVFLKHATEKVIRKGGILFRQGQMHTNTFFIRSGLVKTYYDSPEGRAMTMAHWSRGSMIGGPEFFSHCPHVWSAAAGSDTTVLEISGTRLEELYYQYPDLTAYITHGLAFKIYWLSVMIQIMGTESVTDRIAHLLLRLAELYGADGPNGVVLEHPLSQEDLGKMVGCSRQWVNRTLCHLQAAGLVRTEKRRITLRDPLALRRSNVLLWAPQNP